MFLFKYNLIYIISAIKKFLKNDGNSSIYIIRRCIKVNKYFFLLFNYIFFHNREKKINMITYERVRVAKEYIEKKYRLKKEEEQEKKKDWEEIMSRMTQLNLAEDEAAKIKKKFYIKKGKIYVKNVKKFLYSILNL